MDRYDFIIFDFDDTLWARDEKDIRCSEYNIKFINKYLYNKSIIISGNSFESIQTKLNLIQTTLPFVCAEANSCIFKEGEFISYFPTCEIIHVDEIIHFVEELEVNYQVLKRDNKVFNIKIKPVYSDKDRIEIVDTLNHKFRQNSLDCVARKLGNTTVDILSKNNSKVEAFKALNLYKYKTLYIGDEIYEGNDKDIANLCTRKIAVSNVYETKALLDCFGRRDI